MYKLDLPVDYKEAAAIECRRNAEKQRQSRIFNAKVRTTGIDKHALAQQVEDRKQQEDHELKRSEAFASDAVRNDQIASLLQKRQENDIQKLNKAVNAFRKLHQQPCSRREWDLYDPEALKNDKPARVIDDDPRCTISGLQKFDGEDLNNKARTKFQQEQTREWMQQQIKEKEQANRNQEEANRVHNLKRRELDERAMDLAKAEEQCRRNINMAIQDYNKALERERNEKEHLKRQQEDDDNLTEIANHIHGDILTENPATAQSSFGAHRVIPDRWKGMTPQQLQDVWKTQEAQRKENDRRKLCDKLQNEEWDRQRVANAKAAMLLEREQNRTQSEVMKQQAEENRRLSQEQKAHKKFLDKVVYINPPTTAYFTQFNTTSR